MRYAVRRNESDHIVIHTADRYVWENGENDVTLQDFPQWIKQKDEQNFCLVIKPALTQDCRTTKTGRELRIFGGASPSALGMKVLMEVLYLEHIVQSRSL